MSAQPRHDGYQDLLALVENKDYFVLTTNVDHQFQKAGFDKRRLFYIQGDYGLSQCSQPCHQAAYDNEEEVRRMVTEQKDMKIPTELIPHCPKCGRPMTVNLRCDDTFCSGRGLVRRSGTVSGFSAPPSNWEDRVSGTGRGDEHPGHHQISVLETDSGKPASGLCVYQFGRGGLPAGDCRTVHLHKPGYRDGAGVFAWRF